MTRAGGRTTVALVAVAFLVAACASPGRLVGMRATGEPGPVPRESLAPVTRAGFEAIVAGRRGRPVVVNVWASWCGPCRVEAPLLERAARRYRDRVVFLGVNVRDDPSRARAFLRRYGVGYPNVVDDDGSVTGWLRVAGYPTTVVFDRNGRVRWAAAGGLSEATLAAQLEAVVR